MYDLQCTESNGNLRRDIDVPDSQINHIAEGIQRPKSTGPVFDDFDHSIQSLADGICDRRTDERKHVLQMGSKRLNEILERLKPTSHCRRHPSLQKRLGRLWIDILPELLEFILQYPRPMNAPIALLELINQSGMPLSPVRGMHE